MKCFNELTHSNENRSGNGRTKHKSKLKKIIECANNNFESGITFILVDAFINKMSNHITNNEYIEFPMKNDQQILLRVNNMSVICSSGSFFGYPLLFIDLAE